MLHIEFTAPNFAAVLVAGHLVNTFIAWCIHYLQHQRILGVDFYRVHLAAHHERDRYRSDRRQYMLDVLGHTVWTLMIGFGCLLYFVVLTPWVAWTFVAECALLAACTYYYHHEYDNPRSWLTRFAWFRRCRAWHAIHHGRFEDFSRSRNYAIGGPVTGLLMDRLLGTFRDGDATRRGGGAGPRVTVMASSAVGAIASRTRKFGWKVLYGFLARRFPTADWRFMNYGYADGHAGPALQPEDEPHRCFIQMYARTLEPAGPVAGKDVLEVGCGRGGGSEWIARTQEPRSMVGVDQAGDAIALCQTMHARPNLRFRQGDAERLPLPDAAFDVVLNVESCHHYPSLASFFGEVERVLRPGGRFCVATYWEPSKIEGFHRALQETSLELVETEDITTQVVRALGTTNALKVALIGQHVPWFLKRLLRHFTAVEGTAIHRGFVDGRIRYVAAVLRKRHPDGASRAERAPAAGDAPTPGPDEPDTNPAQPAGAPARRDPGPSEPATNPARRSATGSRWRNIVAPYEGPDNRRSARQLAITFLLYAAAWPLLFWSLEVGYWLTAIVALPAAGLRVTRA